MYIDVLMTAGLALAQPPAPVPLVVPQPVIAAPTRMLTVPQVPPPAGQPAPVAGVEPVIGDTRGSDVLAETPPTKYFIERRLEGTRFGDILTNRGIRVYGWTQMSWNYGNMNQSNAPLQYVDRAGEFLFNQNYFVMEKPIDITKKEFQIGFRGDSIVPGSDARFTLARGLFDGQVTQDGDLYPFDPVQRYAEIFMPNLFAQGTSVKIGKFYTPIEYESVMATATPFVSRSYNFSYNPYTHTGVLATTYLSDACSVYYGAVLGTDIFVDPADRLTFLSGFKWAPPEGKSTLALNTMVTNPKYDTSQQQNNFNAYNVIFTHKFSDKLTYVADAIGSHQTNFPGTSGAAWWYGLAQYMSYSFNNCLIGNARFEVFQDDKGIRTGTQGTYYDATVGVQWKATESIIIAPEFRYDYNKNAPFEGKTNLFVGVVSMIVRW